MLAEMLCVVIAFSIMTPPPKPKEETNSQVVYIQLSTAKEDKTLYDIVGLSEDDFEFMARVVAAEDALGSSEDPYADWDNQVAIAQVIWNRVWSDNWEDTVREVLTAKGQFSTVKSGDCSTEANDSTRLAIVYAYIVKPHPENVIFFNCIDFFSSVEPYKKIGDNYFSYDYD